MPNSLVKRYQMLDFLGDDFYVPEKIHPSRVFSLNDEKIQDGDVLYLMTRELRLKDNWGLLFALELSKKLHRNLKVVLPLPVVKMSSAQKTFIAPFLEALSKDFAKNNIEFVIREDVAELFDHFGVVVSDFNPLLCFSFAKDLRCACFEVDSHNIVPARVASSKQEFSAATFRPKIYQNIVEFLTEFQTPFVLQEGAADKALKDFVAEKLDFYAALKNDPTKEYVSGLSKYMHFGLISSQRVALEVIKSSSSRENKESFLEELLVRKELSDNFCLYSESLNSLVAAPSWAKDEFLRHKDDIREYIYDLSTFESAHTHEPLWNAAQQQLLTEGRIHGYMRMYWAKKILEWSQSPEEALKIALYLNDTYALDGNDPNGVVGILWAIAGLHDRPFFEREVFGKIRYMNENGCRRKFDTTSYINKYLT